MWLLLNGRHEPGHSVLFWGLFAAAIVLMLILPNYISPYAL